MTSICVMGNSHVGSLKMAWDEIGSDFPEINMTFFAQRGTGLDDLIIRDNKLAPNNIALTKALKFTSGGKAEIDTEEYDVFIIYGLGAKANFSTDNIFFSNAVNLAAMKDLVEGTLSFKLLKQLRTLTNKPAFIGHTPLPKSQGILTNAPPKAYENGIKKINKVIYKPLNSELIAQPETTIINGRETHPDFSVGSKRLAVGDRADNKVHPENDTHHMNKKFGEIWLKALFKKL